MEKAVYPQRTCREPVAGEFQMYTCELPEHDGEGPCVSWSVQASVQARERWEEGRAAQERKRRRRRTPVAGA